MCAGSFQLLESPDRDPGFLTVGVNSSLGSCMASVIESTLGLGSDGQTFWTLCLTCKVLHVPLGRQPEGVCAFLQAAQPRLYGQRALGLGTATAPKSSSSSSSRAAISSSSACFASLSGHQWRSTGPASQEDVFGFWCRSRKTVEIDRSRLPRST